MPLYALGLNHTTAPLEVREQVAFQLETLGQALRDLIGRPRVKEAAILSTCNRTEVYFHGADADPVTEWLADFHHVPEVVAVAVPVHVAAGRGRRARVSGGQRPRLDGARRAADPRADEARGEDRRSPPVRSDWCSIACSSARSRSPRTCARSTDIGSASISMAAGAVKLAERIFPSIAEQRVLLIGAGEMIDLAATHFAAKKPRSITVANRTLERGAQLAARFGADAITLSELPERLSRFDIIITSTASSLPILGKGLLERAIKIRRHAPMFIVDLAVPRDVEPEAGKLDDVFLYSVDDLVGIVKDNLQVREDAVREAEAMIADQARNFLNWLDGRSVVPMIAALHGHHDQLRAAELDRARRLLLGGMSPEQVLDQLARGLTNKFLHAPTQALNRAGEAERAELLAMLHRVYQLPDEH